MLLKCFHGFLHLRDVVPAIVNRFHVCLDGGSMINEPLGYRGRRADLSLDAQKQFLFLVSQTLISR